MGENPHVFLWETYSPKSYQIFGMVGPRIMHFWAVRLECLLYRMYISVCDEMLWSMISTCRHKWTSKDQEPETRMGASREKLDVIVAEKVPAQSVADWPSFCFDFKLIWQRDSDNRRQQIAS